MSRRSRWLIMGSAGLVALFIGWVVLTKLVIEIRTVPSPSMQPTVEVGDVIGRLRGSSGSPARDQVVLLHPPRATDGWGSDTCADDSLEREQVCSALATDRSETAYVQRIVGGPGDRLAMKKGILVRNGKPLAEPYVQPCPGVSCDFREITVPAGGWFLLGDNRANSNDSRYYGAIEWKAIMGKVFGRVWPPGRIGGL